MNKVINGKRYDTSTAKIVASWDNEETGFSMISENLHRKRTGEYFLHGSGGANTKYAECSYGSWKWGEEIIPLSEKDARAWAEDHLSADEYESIFGKIEEGTTKKIVTFSLTEKAIESLRTMARESNTSMSEFIENLITKEESK